MANWHYHYQIPQQTTPYQTFSSYTDSNGYQAAQAYWAYNYYQQQAQAARTAQASAAAAAAAAASVATTPAATASTPQQNATIAVIPTAQPAGTTSTFSTYNPSQVRESAGTATRGHGSRKSQLKGLFSKELPKLMYAFGDDKQVANDTVAVMEEILIEYIIDVCQSALAPSRKQRLQIEDLRRVLSRPADAKKLARMEELLFMQEDIKRARKEFNDEEIGGGVDF